MIIKVPNRAFSNNKKLTQLLQFYFKKSVINSKGIRYHGKELVNFLCDANAAIVGLELINDELLDELPNLKFIAKYGVGLDNIDLEACKKRNIQVGWSSGVNKRSVAEMTLGFMLSLTRNLYLTSNQLKDSFWNKDGGHQLSNKTVGIIGLGNIGKEVIDLLKPFNCNVLVNDILDIEEYSKNNNLKIKTKNQIYHESDIISIHTPLTNETNNLINKEVFHKMKSKSFIINTARGKIINEKDLKFALINNIISGAALDVYDIEPPTDKSLIKLPNLICTPHTGGNAKEAVLKMGESAIKHLVEYFNHIK